MLSRCRFLYPPLCRFHRFHCLHLFHRLHHSHRSGCLDRLHGLGDRLLLHHLLDALDLATCITLDVPAPSALVRILVEVGRLAGQGQGIVHPGVVEDDEDVTLSSHFIESPRVPTEPREDLFRHGGVDVLKPFLEAWDVQVRVLALGIVARGVELVHRPELDLWEKTPPVHFRLPKPVPL